jgi:Conserved TM helix
VPIYVENQIRTIISYVPNLIAALVILIVGYIVARIL